MSTTRRKQLWASIFLVAMLAGGQPVFAQTSPPQSAHPCVIDDVSCLKARALDRIEALVMAVVRQSPGQAQPTVPAQLVIDERTAPSAARLFVMVRGLHDASERQAVDERVTRFVAPFQMLRDIYAGLVAEQNLMNSIRPADLDRALTDMRTPSVDFQLRDYIVIGLRGLMQQGLDREAHSIWLRHQPEIQRKSRVVNNEMFRRMLQRQPEVLAKYLWGMATVMGHGRNTLGMMGWEAAQRCGRGDREGGERIVQAMVTVLDAQTSTSPMQRGELVEPVLHCVGVDAANDLVRTLAEQMTRWEALIAEQRQNPQQRAAEIHSLRVAMFDIVAKPVAIHLIQLGRVAEARAVFGLLPAVTSSTQMTLGGKSNTETVTTIRGEVLWEDFQAQAVEQVFRTIDLKLLFIAAAESRITLTDGVVNRLSVVTDALSEAAPRIAASGRELAGRGLARVAGDMAVLQHEARNVFRAREIDHDLLKVHLARETIGSCTLSADQRAGFLQRAASINPDAEVRVLTRLIKRGAPAAGAGVPNC